MRKRSLRAALAAALLILAAVLTACGGEEGGRDTVFEDMKEAFEASGLLSANIGIYSRTEEGGSVSYGEGGSGVIIRRDGNTYYALTAAHVVADGNAQLLVFTVNTEKKTDVIPGTDMEFISQETYESMIRAERVFSSGRDDVAVIRFTSEEDLAVAELAEADPGKGDRILCVGNPQDEWFTVTYGKITSGIEKFGEAQGFPSRAMRHSAWIQVGSSGGAAFDEGMKVIGTVPGGAFSADGKTFKYGVMIPVSELKLCLEEWGG